VTIWNTPERDALRKTVRAFAEREVLPYIDEFERIGELPRELHLKAGEAGLLGAGFPESVGGGGGDGADSLIICEELHYAGAPGGVFASLFTCGIAVPHMIASGDERLIARFVRPEGLHHLRGACRLRGHRRANRRSGRRGGIAARRREGHSGFRGGAQAGQDGLAFL
jgi:alkylation response protein AidB-like acyl-CoA dehydrogenase